MNLLSFFKKNKFPTSEKKRKIIISLAQKYKYPIFIETGTYLGQTIEAVMPFFKQIYSIELSNELHLKAVEKFKHMNNIVLIQGDSGKEISRIIKSINEEIIYWLDGHYSGDITALGDKETPIKEELNAIIKHGSHCLILIDDARLFNGTSDYPTIKELKKHVSNLCRGKSFYFKVKNDIIRIKL